MPEASEVKLTIYNMLDQKVSTIINGKQSAGWHTATFDASGLSSGFYIYRLQAGKSVSTKK
ncbi:MAG: T9SS type A sorting domain-containing protein, partial [Candidatus Paceibacterota bacterium]